MRPAIRRILFAPARYSAWQAVERYAGFSAANGGSVSAARQVQLAPLFEASMICGHFWATDDFALLTAENAGSALTLVKSGVLMTAVAAPTFTIDRGYAFNGTTQYIATGFTPSTMARSMTLGNLRAGVYERTNVAANGDALAAQGGPTIVIRPRSATNVLNVQLASTANTTALSGITDSRGLTVQSRSGGGGTVQSFKNGSALADVSGLAPNNTALPSASLYIGARNTNGVAGSFLAATQGAAEWGAPLPGGAAAELAWYTALQTFMTAIGANV